MTYRGMLIVLGITALVMSCSLFAGGSTGGGVGFLAAALGLFGVAALPRILQWHDARKPGSKR